MGVVVDWVSVLRPAVSKDAFYFDLGCPLLGLGEGPDGNSPSTIKNVGPVSVRIRWAIHFVFLCSGLGARRARLPAVLRCGREDVGEPGAARRLNNKVVCAMPT